MRLVSPVNSHIRSIYKFYLQKFHIKLPEDSPGCSQHQEFTWHTLNSVSVRACNPKVTSKAEEELTAAESYPCCVTRNLSNHFWSINITYLVCFLVLPVSHWRPCDPLRWMVLQALRLSLQWCQDPLSICRMMSFNLPSLKTDGERVLPSLVMEWSPGPCRVLDPLLARKTQIWESLLVPVSAAIGVFWFCCCWEF